MIGGEHPMPDNTTAKSTKLVKKWRYYCEACTGRAVYAVDKHVFNQVTCRSCGANITTYNPGNWFEVTDPEEFAKING